jgi:hypothetical protein
MRVRVHEHNGDTLDAALARRLQRDACRTQIGRLKNFNEIRRLFRLTQ